MKLWSGLRKWWWIAFVVTWLVVTVTLNNTGTSDTASVRVAGIAAALVAGLVWLAARKFGGRSREPERRE
ncbi:MAG: hypothetical protein AB7L91_01605 [Dehalococcoidia bacterium]